MIHNPERLILFDPMCNLCTAVVKYLLRHDKHNRFVYGSLYSKKGKQIKKSLSWKKQKNTIIYLENGNVFTQSDAAIQIISSLPGLHRLFLVLKIFPKSFRDFGYKIVAKYRYQWFGKREVPFAPDPKWKEKFIDFDELTSAHSVAN